MSSLSNKTVNHLADSLTKLEKDRYSEEEFFEFAGFNEKEAEKIAYSNYSYWKSTFKNFRKNKTASFFFILICTLLTFSIIQPLLPNQKDPIKSYKNEKGMPIVNQAPNKEFIFGTNSIGQDYWSQIWSGTRTSLFIGFSVAFVEAFVGILIGVLWGYVKQLDFIFTEIYNLIDNIPQTIVLVIMSYILRPSKGTLILAMCITGWLPMSRFIRNQIVIIRDRDYNLASRCLGTPTHRIILRNLLPYLISVIMLRMALAIPSAIANEIFITYIGLGLPVNTPSLGNLLNSSRILLFSDSQRYQLIFPVIVISIITISFYMIGNAFADAADPKSHV